MFGDASNICHFFAAAFAVWEYDKTILNCGKTVNLLKRSTNWRPFKEWRCTEFNHCFTLLIFLPILGQENSSIPENDFADFVDTILENQDYDDDGFIDYPEFVRSFQQHREGPE